MNQQQIAEGIRKQFDLLTQWYKEQDRNLFSHSGEEEWSSGQHLYHLVKSSEPIAKGMGLPPFLLKLRFGKYSDPSRSYEEVVAAYKNSLGNGAKATGEYVPRPIGDEEKQAILNRFEKAGQQLEKYSRNWKESQFDQIAIPHPILGKISLRELLYFTIYHTEHHLHILQQRFPQH